MRIAFDEEVTPEKAQIFLKNILQFRNPSSVSHKFAFRALRIQGFSPSVFNQPAVRDKDKSGTRRGIAKKTFLKTARQVGLKPKKEKESPRRIQLSNSGVSISETREEEDDTSGKIEKNYLLTYFKA